MKTNNQKITGENFRAERILIYEVLTYYYLRKQKKH